MEDTHTRVKLYVRKTKWCKLGIGHLFTSHEERLNKISLSVKAESDGSCMLQSVIQPDTLCVRKKVTVIDFFEENDVAYSLKFQYQEHCDEIWKEICRFQGKDPSVDRTQDKVEESKNEFSDDTTDSSPPVELPPCELSRLHEISVLIGRHLSSRKQKKKLGLAIKNEGYIRKLLKLFHMCEDSENMEGLHYLYEIVKKIFMLNRNELFEVMFGEETIFDVVGCLEYDPTLPSPKRHRLYLKQFPRYKEVIPITNPALSAKIRQTYRVQYIQDVVVPTSLPFEDDPLSKLSQFIFSNKKEIVVLIQEDKKFLSECFALLRDEATDELKGRDLILFLKEVCTFSHNLETSAEELLYQTLSSLGILPALEITLRAEDPQTKTASIDILTCIIKCSPSIVHVYMLQQINNSVKDQMLINVIIKQMIRNTDPELGGAVQLMGILRILLNPKNMLRSRKRSKFLKYFFKHSVPILTAPLLENTMEDSPGTEDHQTVELLELILEFLSFCVDHHIHRTKNYLVSEDLFRRILVLMNSRNTFLALCSLRFMRKIIALKDKYFNKCIIKGNLLAPVVDIFVRNNGQHNLLDSTILEMFEFIKLERIKSLCFYLVENFGKILDDSDCGKTFKALKRYYEKHQAKHRGRGQTTLDSSSYRCDQHHLEEVEEEIRPSDIDHSDGGEVQLLATNDILGKELDSELDSTGEIIEEEADGNAPNTINSSQPSNILNDACGDTTGSSSATLTAGDVKSTTRFKKGLSKKIESWLQKPADQENKKHYKCIQCKESFRHRRLFICHMKTHERPYECPKCGESFPKHSNKTQHMRIHVNEKFYKCSECKKSFRYKSFLTKHMYIHTSEKPYKCNHCEKSFKKKRNLNAHLYYYKKKSEIKL